MIQSNEYAKRRQELMQAVGATSIIIIPSANELPRTGDATYPFRQTSDLYYLTGFSEPESVLVLAPNRQEGEYILFNRVRDREREIWDGPRVGQEGAVKDLKANQAFPISEFKKMLPELLAGREKIFYPIGFDRMFDRLIIRSLNKVKLSVRSGLQSPSAIFDIGPVLHELRLIKSVAEIALMQKAIDITERAHIKAMQACQPGMYEYELEAELMYTFIKNGARFSAYSSIVGSGENSCVLHYIANNKKIAAHDLILIDAGAEYENYAADITRTFPANGKFSGEQKAIYELVLASQLAAIDSIKPNVSWTTAQDVVVKIITQGLIDLKILQGNVDDLIAEEAYFPFYMHRSGHWLGLDVHDVGRYRVGKEWRTLQPGMTFTVEPGIYISENLKQVDKRWHNIGVRIEDNVLVTEKGCDVLSKKIPKKVTDIEAIMKH